MVLITAQELVDYCGFSMTGSTIYVPQTLLLEGGGQQFTLPSGSFQAIINASLNYIVPLIQKDTTDSGFVDWDANLTTTNVIDLSKSFALDYCAFRVWVTLFGAVISGGWSYTLSELSVRREQYLPTIRAIVESYKSAAASKLQLLQPMSLSIEGERIEDLVGSTSPSYY